MPDNPQTSTRHAEALELSSAELQRYARHITMPEVGIEGQKRLKGARVLLVGTGGLGAPVGMYLAAAGVGRIGLVDFDVVDASNLQRQVVFSTEEIGRKKLEATRERLQGINPHVQFDLCDWWVGLSSLEIRVLSE